MWNRKKTIIIAGCSRFGAGLAGELSEHGDDVIIIDMDNDAFRKLPPNFSGFQIVGNVTDPDLLEDAGIENASVVVAATDDDNINCMLAQMARRIYDVGEVFARLNDTDKEHLIGGLNIKAIYPARLSIEKFKELSSIAF
ncbi:TrkA family potassium uptake protein [Lachnoclostridium pacaense]|uniref:potassium channel family protein n=1 Tax=Enterocloster hominis (ex Hitch et al. 2024) TaxID=1917870 RepID=UPI001D0FB7D7|nr:TrkA family potassium uptake protein [Lachnoclostridium pacaense]MCC2817474.1 TrkA family potassium uptake protein [Lachnoclostridium pacaense]MCC2879273.1 TrkA family potassium uptake protein [Lachnoclostridium pacaense]